LPSLANWIAGEPSCGCFGAWSVHPAAAFALDMSALIGLVLTHGASMPSPKRARWFGPAVVGVVASFGLLPVAIGAKQPGATDEIDNGLVLLSNGAVFVKPDDWVGKRFPLAPHIDIGDELVRGEWLVVFYRRDCDECRTAISEYEQGATHAYGECRIALIEVPIKSVAVSWQPMVASNPRVLIGRLGNEHRWFVSVPMSVTIREGKVISSEIKAFD
jgi:hypothetical protein